MEEFDKLLAYLKKNLIDYKVSGDCIVTIADKTYELYTVALDGVLFDESFRFCGIPASAARRLSGGDVTSQCDNYVYKFGGVWYYLPVGEEEDVKLRRLKYLGTAVQTIPTGVFLGVHGQYEIMSGSGTYKDWCSKAKFLGVHTLGICEKNSLAGALKFQMECKANDIKSVIGMECTVYDSANDYRFTVKVFVRNEAGWRDLLTINKAINCDNLKFIGLDEFRKITTRNDNLIVILDPKTIDYDKFYSLMLDCALWQFDPCEYTDDTRDEWYLRNLKKFYHDTKLMPVAMVDAWYLDEEYAGIRDRLQSIGDNKFYASEDQYFKCNDEIFKQVSRLFPETEAGLDEACTKFLDSVDCLEAIAESIDFSIDVSKRHLPRYKMTPEEAAQFATNEDLFWHLLSKGLDEHPDLIAEWGEDIIMERVDREVGVIKLGDAIDYFLITWDIINWCHRNGIMTGVSRGSAGGCLVSYLMGITKLDPLKYNLLFERFLNEGRVKVTLPDIDVDYPGEDRPRVKKYMEERYGWNQVCSVGTYSALQLRAAIKDMARVYGLEFQDVNEMMKLFSVDDRKPEDLFRKALASDRVKKFVNAHSDIINEVLLVMPAPKAQSIHACAMMVFPNEHDMFHWVPVRKQGDDYVTEWEGGEMDAAGFLKEDVLGVKQLDKFQDMVRLIKEHEGVDVDIFKIPLDDPQVYEFFCNGWNEDNFHFGSRGLIGYCKEMQPTNIEDLIVAISLYRPGAMENGFHEKYIKCKTGEEEVAYFVGTEDILKNTYGVFCYQEQIMELCKKLGGLTLVEADDVRKAMVKKKYEALHQYHERFTPYYMEHFGVTKEYAEQVWDAIDKASTYLFNRSHAAAYAITGYISQWLKVHYPIEYWSVAFKYATDDDYSRYVAEINKTGVCTVHPVDINVSDTGVVIDFDNKALYWSILGVKQVADKAASQILKERAENGQYWSLSDFVSRHKWKGSAVNTRVVQNLILAGAFDKVENIASPNERAVLLADYIASAKVKTADALLTDAGTHVNQDWWWSLMQKRVSGLAFFDYRQLYEQNAAMFDFSEDEANIDGAVYRYYPVEDCNGTARPNNGYVVVGGYVTDVELKHTKGGVMCRLVLESNYEFLEVIAFATEYERLQGCLQNIKDSLILISGRLQYDTRKDYNCLRLDALTNLVSL